MSHKKVDENSTAETRYARRPYTREERDAIVAYICETKRFAEIKGQKLFQDIAAAGIVDRPWSSMWEHFRKQIIPVLHSSRFPISDEDRLQFMLHARYFSQKLIRTIKNKLKQSNTNDAGGSNNVHNTNKNTNTEQHTESRPVLTEEKVIPTASIQQEKNVSEELNTRNNKLLNKLTLVSKQNPELEQVQSERENIVVFMSPEAGEHGSETNTTENLSEETRSQINDRLNENNNYKHQNRQVNSNKSREPLKSCKPVSTFRKTIKETIRDVELLVSDDSINNNCSSNAANTNVNQPSSSKQNISEKQNNIPKNTLQRHSKNDCTDERDRLIRKSFNNDKFSNSITFQSREAKIVFTSNKTIGFVSEQDVNIFKTIELHNEDVLGRIVNLPDFFHLYILQEIGKMANLLAVETCLSISDQIKNGQYSTVSKDEGVESLKPRIDSCVKIFKKKIFSEKIMKKFFEDFKDKLMINNNINIFENRTEDSLTRDINDSTVMNIVISDDEDVIVNSEESIQEHNSIGSNSNNMRISNTDKSKQKNMISNIITEDNRNEISESTSPLSEDFLMLNEGAMVELHNKEKTNNNNTSNSKVNIQSDIIENKNLIELPERTSFINISEDRTNSNLSKNNLDDYIVISSDSEENTHFTLDVSEINLQNTENVELFRENPIEDYQIIDDVPITYNKRSKSNIDLNKQGTSRITRTPEAVVESPSKNKKNSNKSPEIKILSTIKVKSLSKLCDPVEKEINKHLQSNSVSPRQKLSADKDDHTGSTNKEISPKTGSSTSNRELFIITRESNYIKKNYCLPKRLCDQIRDKNKGKTSTVYVVKPLKTYSPRKTPKKSDPIPESPQRNTTLQVNDISPIGSNPSQNTTNQNSDEQIANNNICSAKTTPENSPVGSNTITEDNVSQISESASADSLLMQNVNDEYNKEKTDINNISKPKINVISDKILNPDLNESEKTQKTTSKAIYSDNFIGIDSDFRNIEEVVHTETVVENNSQNTENEELFQENPIEDYQIFDIDDVPIIFNQRTESTIDLNKPGTSSVETNSDNAASSIESPIKNKNGNKPSQEIKTLSQIKVKSLNKLSDPVEKEINTNSESDSVSPRRRRKINDDKNESTRSPNKTYITRRRAQNTASSDLNKETSEVEESIAVTLSNNENNNELSPEINVLSKIKVKSLSKLCNPVENEANTYSESTGRKRKSGSDNENNTSPSKIPHKVSPLKSQRTNVKKKKSSELSKLHFEKKDYSPTKRHQQSVNVKNNTDKTSDIHVVKPIKTYSKRKCPKKTNSIIESPSRMTRSRGNNLSPISSPQTNKNSDEQSTNKNESSTDTSPFISCESSNKDDFSQKKTKPSLALSQVCSSQFLQSDINYSQEDNMLQALELAMTSDSE